MNKLEELLAYEELSSYELIGIIRKLEHDLATVTAERDAARAELAVWAEDEASYF